MFSTVRQLPKVRVLLDRRRSEIRYNFIPVLSTISPEMAQWTSRIVGRGGGSPRGVVDARMGRETRVQDVYPGRTIRYNTRTRRTRARFLRSMNRSPRFDSCTRITHARRRLISGKKRDIEPSLHFQYPLYRAGSARRIGETEFAPTNVKFVEYDLHVKFALRRLASLARNVERAWNVVSKGKMMPARALRFDDRERERERRYALETQGNSSKIDASISPEERNYFSI